MKRFPHNPAAFGTVILAALFAGSAHAGNTLPMPQVQGDCASGTCTVTVECGGLPPKQAELRVTSPSTGQVDDTAVFFMGGSGTSYWGDASQFARQAIDALAGDGFRAVEVRWIGENWANGGPDGPATAACRPASIVQFVHAHFAISATGGLLHLTGNSAGAAQVAYSLSHYGLDPIVRSAVVTGGPPYARIDLGCFGDDTGLRYRGDAPNWIDRTFGFPSPGPCRNENAAYSETYRAASVVSDTGKYSYPKTAVHFIFGTADTSNSDEQGLLYFQRLLAEKSPYLAVEYIPGMPHELPKSEAGTAAVADALRLYRK